MSSSDRATLEGTPIVAPDHAAALTMEEMFRHRSIAAAGGSNSAAAKRGKVSKIVLGFGGDGEFSPGATVRGRVKLRTVRDTPALSVGVLIQGFEKVWTGNSRGGRHKSYTSVEFFSHRVVLWEPKEGESSVFPKGTTSWRFQFDLDHALPPSSLYEDCLFVFYQARAYVQPAAADQAELDTKIISSTQYLDIVGSHPSLLADVAAHGLPSFASTRCRRNRTLALSAHVKKSDIVLGTVLPVYLKLSNGKSGDVPPVTVTLHQAVSIHASKFSRTFPSVALAAARLPMEKRAKSDTLDEMFVVEVPLPSAETFDEELDESTTYPLPSIAGRLATCKHTLRITLGRRFRELRVDLPIRLFEPPVQEDEQQQESAPEAGVAAALRSPDRPTA